MSLIKGAPQKYNGHQKGMTPDLNDWARKYFIG